MCQVTNIQTSVPAMNPGVAHELALAPLDYGLEAPGKQHLRQSSMNKRPIVEVHISMREMPTHQWSKKIYNFGRIGEDSKGWRW